MRGFSVKHLLMGLVAVTVAFTSGIVKADPDGPSPLGKGSVTMPFPWENIGGVWQLNDPSENSVFSFDVKKTQDGNKVLQVVQVDKGTNQVIAEGAGVAIPGDKNTVSVMMAGEGQDPYMLYVRHVREKRYSRRQATVITIKQLSHGPDQPVPVKPRNFILKRVSEVPFPQSYFDKERESHN